MSTNSSEDLNQQVLIGECSSVLRQVNIESDHLFRHLTEVNGKDTRVSRRIDSVDSFHLTMILQGGYIEGQLEFQEALLQVRIFISENQMMTVFFSPEIICSEEYFEKSFDRF